MTKAFFVQLFRSWESSTTVATTTDPGPRTAKTLKVIHEVQAAAHDRSSPQPADISVEGALAKRLGRISADLKYAVALITHVIVAKVRPVITVSGGDESERQAQPLRN